MTILELFTLVKYILSIMLKLLQDLYDFNKHAPEYVKGMLQKDSPPLMMCLSQNYCSLGYFCRGGLEPAFHPRVSLGELHEPAGI